MNNLEKVPSGDPESESDPKKGFIGGETAESQVENSRESLLRRKATATIDLGIHRSVLESLQHRWSPEHKEKEAQEKQFLGDKIERALGPYIDQAAKFLHMDTREDVENRVLEEERAKIQELETELLEIDAELGKIE